MDNFVLFMADVSLKQFKEFLKIITRQQINYLKEIANNILQSVIKLTREDKLVLKRGRHFLRKFTRRGASKCLIVKNYKIIHKIIKITKEALT